VEAKSPVKLWLNILNIFLILAIFFKIWKSQSQTYCNKNFELFWKFWLDLIGIPLTESIIIKI